MAQLFHAEQGIKVFGNNIFVERDASYDFIIGGSSPEELHQHPGQ
jgi:hypothetical protein